MAETMKAYRIAEEHGPGGWAEVEVPHAGPGEVLLKNAAAGLCRTDLELMDHGAVFYPWSGAYTIGHETAGHVVEVGDGVVGLAEGDAVLVHSNTSCGRCRNCFAGRDNFCLQRPPIYGYADNGGLAPYMVARQRDVVHLGSLDPKVAAPLADAGATAYGSFLDIRPYLEDDGYVAVIGVGGVGGMAVQLLRTLSSVHVIAVDLPDRLDIARANGAQHVVASSPSARDEIMEITGGRGVQASIDIVGSDDTLALCAGITASLGAVSLVGLAGGTLPFNFMSLQWGVRLFSSTTCSLGNLSKLVSIVEREQLTVQHQAFAFDDVEKGYDALRAGKVAGRAVIDFSLDG
ncbi:MAG: alcohol dehydrogenase catalytic domain-containing protein [Janthinobacterium lividum]